MMNLARSEKENLHVIFLIPGLRPLCVTFWTSLPESCTLIYRTQLAGLMPRFRMMLRWSRRSKLCAGLPAPNMTRVTGSRNGRGPFWTS